MRARESITPLAAAGRCGAPSAQGLPLRRSDAVAARQQLGAGACTCRQLGAAAPCTTCRRWDRRLRLQALLDAACRES